jgi:hypothetical protein
MTTKDIIKSCFDKWAKPLGLLWWHVDLVYFTEPADVIREFAFSDEEIVLARTYADWRYGTASIHFNVPGFDGLSLEEIERTVVHELVHILVNEMREGEMHHEERVVTGLTKAMFWLREEQCHSKNRCG